MKEPTESGMYISMHQPVTAGFIPVTTGDFGYIQISDKTPGRHQINLMITHRNGNDLLFLYQLREAVEQAFKYYLEKEH